MFHCKFHNYFWIELNACLYKALHLYSNSCSTFNKFRESSVFLSLNKAKKILKTNIQSQSKWKLKKLTKLNPYLEETTKIKKN